MGIFRKKLKNIYTKKNTNVITSSEINENPAMRCFCMERIG